MEKDRCELKFRSGRVSTGVAVYVATAVISCLVEGVLSDLASVNPMTPTARSELNAQSVGTVLILYAEHRPMQTERVVTSAGMAPSKPSGSTLGTYLSQTSYLFTNKVKRRRRQGLDEGNPCGGP